jgi:8-oxo-dGTP diphosphatase
MNKKIICRDKDENKYKVNEERLKFRPSVYGILIENNKILLSKQWDGYDFPGGGIKIHETIEGALKREFFEETGIKVQPVKVLHVDTDFFHPVHSLKHKDEYWNCQLIYFLVKKVGGKLSKSNFDKEEKIYADLAEWISIEDIEKIKFYSPVNNPRLARKAFDFLNS